MSPKNKIRTIFTKPFAHDGMQVGARKMAFRMTLPGLLCLFPLALQAEPVPAFSPHLENLGRPPLWEELDPHQRRLTAAEFRNRLLAIYASKSDAWTSRIEIFDEYALIQTSGADPDARYRLHFRRTDENPVQVARYWTPARDRPPPSLPEQLLQGVHIALDPGHIGGDYAQMEERWFQIGSLPAVMEGEMALRTAEILQDKLVAEGARVTLVRQRNQPVSPYQPSDFLEYALADLEDRGISPGKFLLQKFSERLFYLASEIRARADLVNRLLQPDLVVCLHYNAEAWGNPSQPELVSNNHLHVLVNGCFTDGEFAKDDQLFELLDRLLENTIAEELPLADEIARSLQKVTGLPAYRYPGSNAKRVLPANPYVWARNLLASRLYQCPVIYLEPYVMNSWAVYPRAVLGEYSGTKVFGGQARQNLFQEYAEGVSRGIVAHYRKARPQAKEE
ncbi:MAG: hypothetical protein AAF555_09900 [Verrucomicrobiota bacterium]